MKVIKPLSRNLPVVVGGVLLLFSSSAGALEHTSRPARNGDSPSEIEIHIARAAAAAYLNDYRALDEEYTFFKSMDDFLKTKGQTPTGLSDNILDIAISNIRERDEFIEAQQNLLRETPDRLLKERVKFRLADEAKNGDSLLLTDRYNRFAFVFNTFVRPLSLLAVGYFPALIDAGVATLLNIGSLTDISVEEKKALVLYNQFLDKYPDSDKAEILRHRITELDKKRIKKCHNLEMLKAQEHIREGNYWQAQQRYKNALAYQPDSRKASDGLKRARELELEEHRLKGKSLEPAKMDIPFYDNAADRDYQDILYAAASNSPEMIIYEGEDFLSKYPKSELVPQVLYTIAVAHDMKDDHDRAKEIMADIAARYRGTHIGRHAAAYLADPEYNLHLAFQSSRRQRGKQTTRYVLMGQDFAKSNVILGTSRLITQGLTALQSLGTFNVLAMGIRGINTLLRNPVSDEAVIDNGLKYLRRYPDSPAAPQIHLALARAYAKRKNLSKSVYHFAASGMVNKKKLAKMREKAAKQYLDFAKAAESKEEKIRCYEMILDEYPHAKAAAAALDQLALLEKTEKPLFQMDKKTIFENPILFELTELNLSPRLLDNDNENSELANRGLYSARRGEITIVYKDGKNEREESVKIDYPTYKRLMAFAEEVKYRHGFGGREKKKLAGRFPIELRGTVSGDGVYVYPRLKVKSYRDKDLYLYK